MNARMSSIAVRLPLTISLICFLVAALMTFMNYTAGKQALTLATEQRLTLALKSRENELRAWLTGLDADLTFFADNAEVRDAIRAFDAGWNELGQNPGVQLQQLYTLDNPNPAGKKDLMDDAGDGSSYSAAHARYHPFFRKLKDSKGYYDIFLFAPDGRLVYTVFKEPDFATDFAEGPYASSGLGKAFRAAMENPSDVVIADFEAYSPSGGIPAAFVAHQVKDANGEVLGVLAYQMPIDRLAAVVNEGTGLGETGQVVLIGADQTRRNASRFEGGGDLLEPVVQNEAVQAALAGETGFRQNIIGQNGDMVSAAYSSYEFGGVRWAIVAEQDTAELNAPLIGMRNSALMFLAVSALLSAVIGTWTGRRIALPLTRLGGTMDKIAAGSFETKVPFVERKDEVGTIARNLSSFRDGLKAADEARQMTLFKSRAFEAAGTAMMLIDRNLVILDHNAALADLFQRKIDDLRRQWPELDVDALRGASVDALLVDAETRQRLRESQAGTTFEAELCLGMAQLSLHAAPILEEDGTCAGYALQFSDIAEERTNRSIIETIRRNQAMVEYSPTFDVRQINANFSKVFGWGPEVVGKNFEHLFGPNEDTRVQIERLTKGLTVQRKVQRPSKDGGDVWVEISMNAVRDRNGRLDRIIEIANDVTAMERARIAADQKRAEMEANQSVVVDALRIALKKLSDGDLMSPITDQVSPDYEGLKQDFNAAVNRLSEAMLGVLENADLIRGEASEISNAADDLSRRTEKQAATLEQTATALDQLTSSVRSAAEGAARANQMVGNAKSSAENGGNVVRRAVDAMSAIESSSSKIAKITGVIDDIAFQTNLLALNAGVEAARAGEAGRGFAVVASEVRALAQRSSEAAREINDLISDSGNHVKMGVKLVADTGEALKAIVNSVTEISAQVSDIAVSAREQSSGLAEINTAVNQLDQVTQQNAAMFEETTAASHALTSEAEALSRAVSLFKCVPQGKTADARDMSGSRNLSVKGKATDEAKAPPLVLTSPIAATSRGNAAVALKAAAVPVEIPDEWQDF